MPFFLLKEIYIEKNKYIIVDDIQYILHITDEPSRAARSFNRS